MGKSKMSKAGRLLCMVLSMVLLAGCSSSNPEAGAGKKEQKEEQGQTEVLRGQQAPDPGPERELPYGIDRK